MFRLLVDLLKVGLIAVLAGSYLLDHFGETQYFSKVPVSASFEIAINICKGLIYRNRGWVLVMGIVDYAVNYWRFEKSLRMTRDELKQEMREAEGDPAIKRRRRSFAQRVVQQSRVSGSMKRALSSRIRRTWRSLCAMTKHWMKHPLCSPRVLVCLPNASASLPRK